MRRLRLPSLFALGVLILGVVMFAIDFAHKRADQMSCMMTFRAVALGLQNYHDVYERFPPVVVCTENSTPIHSWRPMLLPFMVDFPAVYNWKEPWDGKDNMRLINGHRFHFDAPVERVRSIGPYGGPIDFSQFYRCHSFASESPFATNVVAVRGAHTAWPGTRAVSLSEFTDSPESTILLVETAISNIMWTEPRDLEWDTMSFVINDKERPCIGGSHPDGPCVAMANGETYRLNPRTPPDIIRGLLTIDGDEPLTIEALDAAGWIRH